MLSCQGCYAFILFLVDFLNNLLITKNWDSVENPSNALETPSRPSIIIVLYVGFENGFHNKNNIFIESKGFI